MQTLFTMCTKAPLLLCSLPSTAVGKPQVHLPGLHSAQPHSLLGDADPAAPHVCPTGVCLSGSNVCVGSAVVLCHAFARAFKQLQ